MKVLKFGGSSVSAPARINSVIEIVRLRLANEKLALVFSAFGGVTDVLIDLSKKALAGEMGYLAELAELENRHVEAVRELLNVQRQASVLAHVKATFNELEDVLHGVFLVKERTDRSLDYIMSFGERLSAYIIAQAFISRNIEAEFLDARRVIRTDSHFGSARVDFTITNQNIEGHFNAHSGLQIITGFIGASETGETTTLGRSGSDYTAAIFAGALKASSLEIWTDVDGMMTADPRKVKRAFTVKEMTYEEAMELSHFGARVIFPATMQPAMVNSIPIWIKNTFNPAIEGTIIWSQANGKAQVVKGISSMSNISLLNVQGSGLMGVVGVSMRLFSALGREKINVILISQASSEHSICIAVESQSVAKAKAAIEQEFMYEIRNDEMEPVGVEDNRAIVAIVGENMRHNPGTSGRMFTALGKNGVNVYAIAQGSSELNISAVVREEDVSKSLNALHEAFFLSDRKVLHVFLVGTGLIGKTLLKMIKEQFASLTRENRLEVNVVAVANSKKMLFDEAGLEIETAIDLMKDKGEAMNMDFYFKKMKELNLSNSIFVDCTSSEAVTEFYQHILNESVSIVTPNKKANSGPLIKYETLKKISLKRNVRFLYETNVGAGLPVISTLNDLLLSGDKVIRIEAVLSGTMNFIFSSFTEGRKFSEVVREAQARGYTEPDPRDDLNGMDVARKALLLSREAGHKLEIENIETQNLVPEDCQGDISQDEFFKRLQEHDHSFETLREKHEAKGERLRYMAILENGKASVSLEPVGTQHPFYSLSGSDNILLLTTERYHERPMVIRGPGAGATVTAAGVFADIIRIGNYVI